MTELDPTLQALTLLQLPGVGQVTARKLLRSGIGELAEATKRAVPNLKGDAWTHAEAEARKIFDACIQQSIEPIGIGSPHYPVRLKGISDSPVVIYVKGDRKALARDGIAIVGTRAISTTGQRLTRMIAEYTASRGFVVVSGLALGVDAAAHEATLKANGTTVAVLAHGLHQVSPASHKRLAEKILDQGGALMSEHPPGVPPRPAEFVRRNRLQSGLSLGSIIVESGIEGGSMHQARFTKSQGRHLMAVLASSAATRGDLNEEGANELIQNLGASPIRGLSELGRILDSLTVVAQNPLPPAELF